MITVNGTFAFTQVECAEFDCFVNSCLKNVAGRGSAVPSAHPETSFATPKLGKRGGRMFVLINHLTAHCARRSQSDTVSIFFFDLTTYAALIWCSGDSRSQQTRVPECVRTHAQLLYPSRCLLRYKVTITKRNIGILVELCQVVRRYVGTAYLTHKSKTISHILDNRDLLSGVLISVCCFGLYNFSWDL